MQRSRHVGFHALMEAMGQPGCPACRLASRAGRRFLETLLYEQVNDPQIRGRLRRAGGLCHEHSASLLALGDALGSSILYADLVTAATSTLKGGNPERCPACQSAARAAQRALDTLLNHLAEEDVLAAFEASDGLCMQHLGQVTSAGSPAAKTAAEVERERLRQLAAECQEFVAKSDYRCQDGPTGPERNAWQRAIRKLGGGFPGDGAQ